MNQRTAFLPGLSHLLCGRQRRSQLDQVRAHTERVRQSSLSRLNEIFGPWLPTELFAASARGLKSRQRLYPLRLTFWAFLSQVLSPGSSCREVVRKVQAWYAPQDAVRPDSRSVLESTALSGSPSYGSGEPRPGNFRVAGGTGR